MTIHNPSTIFIIMVFQAAIVVFIFKAYLLKWQLLYHIELGHYCHRLKINGKCPKNLHHGNLMVEDAGKNSCRHKKE